MTALKETWQQQRRQRQQQQIDRQQQVQTMLNGFQKTRHHQAIQQQIDRHEFHQHLQQEVANELAAIARDRAILAQQFQLDLQGDRQKLSSAVVSLRQNLKQQMRSLQAETNSLLNSYQQKRQEARQQQAKELAVFVMFLQAEVRDYLAELAVKRPTRAAEIQQMLRRDRIQRQNAIEALFQELADFRVELRQYRQTLSEMVWGEAIEVVKADRSLGSFTVESPLNSPVVRDFEDCLPEVQIERLDLAESSESIEPVAEASEVVEPVESIESEPAETVLLEDPWAEIDQPTRALLKNEARIYDYLAKQQGARLTEIETLGLTRFQIVDALRSLTQKGRVQQHDRLYFVKD